MIVYSCLLIFNMLKRKDQAYKLMRSDEWTNIDIEVFNNMLAFLDFYSKNKNIINELAVEGKRIFDEYRNSLNSVLLRYKLKGKCCGLYFNANFN